MRDGKLKSGYGPYRARDLFKVPLNCEDGPIWTFDRMGATRNDLPDGRILCIGGNTKTITTPISASITIWLSSELPHRSRFMATRQRSSHLRTFTLQLSSTTELLSSVVSVTSTLADPGTRQSMR